DPDLGVKDGRAFEKLSTVAKFHAVIGTARAGCGAMISTSDGRRAPRWSARIPVRYQVFEPQDGELSLGQLDAARARDIGSDGLFLAGVDQPLGTRLHFFFELP